MNCKITGCEAKYNAKGFCKKHYDASCRNSKFDRIRFDKWRLANPDRVKSHRLQWKYGITLEDKIQMYKNQKGFCALCGGALPLEISKCCVDHNHKTDVVRGLLHHQCNIALGYIEKDISLLFLIPKYLRLFS